MKTDGTPASGGAGAAGPRNRSGSRLGTAFRRIMRGLADDLARADEAGAHGFEAIHRRRVTIRRLRSMIVLFEPCLDPAAASRLAGELRALGRAYGAVRDWDVACLKTFPKMMDGAPVAEAAAILTASDAARQRAHDALDRDGVAVEAQRLAASLRSWVATASCMKPGFAGHRLAEAAPALLFRLDRRVIRRGKGVKDLSRGELHALRKALKRLNYGMEALAPLYSDIAVDAFRAACADLLARLGRFNDAVVAQALAREIADEHLPSRDFVRPWARRRRRKARRRLPAAWRAFRNAPRPWDEAAPGRS